MEAFCQATRDFAELGTDLIVVGTGDATDERIESEMASDDTQFY